MTLMFFRPSPDDRTQCQMVLVQNEETTVIDIPHHTIITHVKDLLPFLYNEPSPTK